MASNYPGSNFSGPPPSAATGGSSQAQQDPFAAAAAIAAKTAASLSNQLGGKVVEQGGPSFGSGGYGGQYGDRAAEDRRQLFVGGIPEGITDDGFHQYFSQFGHVERAIVMTDKMTGRCRGFGFVTYSTTDEVEVVIMKGGPHQLNGKRVDVNRSQDPKDPHRGGWGSDRSGGPSRRGGDDPMKVFCGGLQSTLSSERLRQHFSQYGNIVDCIAMRDRDTGRSKGYGFVTFDSEDAVAAAINGNNMIDGRWVRTSRFGTLNGMEARMEGVKGEAEAGSLPSLKVMVMPILKLRCSRDGQDWRPNKRTGIKAQQQGGQAGQMTDP
ncbi:conserved hypothetical protein [Perkinsus marinus ATCC 50983]|uniref:RRM domain-containing protein n=1 Tax=Perkinsus marinus (strain ATCC 50983 / TXsc) TaxID=423536 RepID=C5L6I5_PERM5|nr:conserved hypothetical protein [Perkinsus marinus ATCC 50983]EER07646.1 conserved hypothetical protein [Perkinsus marinus ATCC 50983]|eukprot:XP_002775830.1 conserved hypothetical protein [Perkinsus marinus ATCC 50983]